LSKVWGFAAQSHIVSLAERDVRIAVSLYAVGDDSEERRRVPPILVDCTGPKPRRVLIDVEPKRVVSPLRYQVQNGALAVSIDLLDEGGRFNPELGWKMTTTGAPKAHMIDWLSVADTDVTQQLQVLVVARPPSLRKAPVEREWLERHFVAGGLPSLGKRR
jgi:hypothetical protein